MSAKTWAATECDTTWLSGFPLGILPFGLESQIRVLVRGSDVGLEIGSIIGTIPLTNGDTLHIAPKVGVMNYFRMLLIAEGLRERSKSDFESFVKYTLDDDEDASLPELLARRFFTELGVIRATGLRFGRSKARKTLETPSGRVRMVSSNRRMRQRAATPFICDVNERDWDIAENRVLAAAANNAAGLIKQFRVIEDWQYKLVFKWSSAYFRPETLHEDLALVTKGLATGEYGGPRGNYVQGLLLAKLILGQAGLIQGGAAEIYGDAMLVNSATLFEEYVRAVISVQYKDKGLTVLKGGAPIQFLYNDGTFSLNPDIRISQGLRTLTIGDAKYKTPDAGDHYQLAAYMRAYGVEQGFLLSPDYGDEVEPVTYKRSPDGKTVVEFRLPMKDLAATEKILRNLDAKVTFLSH